MKKSVLALIMCCAAQLAFAQAYPTKPIRVVVSFSAGSGLDIFARILTPRLTDTLGQPVIVDNRAGAGGRIGHEAAAKAPPDGYTLLITALGPFIHTPILTPQTTFDPVRDFAPISPLVTGPITIVVHPSLPVMGVKELVALARRRPGELKYGSTGVGSINHLIGEMINQFAGTKLLHVPYKGAGEALTDLLGGQIEMVMTAPAPVIPHIKAGKLRVIVTTGRQRIESMPHVQTMAEAGLPQAEVVVWWGMVAPAATPRPIIDRLNREVVQALALPQVREQYLQQGVYPETSSPERFGQLIRDDYARWTKIIRAAGIKVE